MEAGNLGASSSYLAAYSGVPVYAGDQSIVGTLMHVLESDGLDVFDGIIIEASVGGGGARFVDAPYVDAFYERGVTLHLDRESCTRLPRPQAPPAARDATAAPDPSGLTEKLHRAWRVLSGRD